MQKRVIIIGAGPGGGAAAVRLAQRGVKDVLLLDKDSFPRDKTCGSALSPNALQTLESLGLGAEVRRLGYPINALRLVTPGRRALHLASEQAAIVLLRKDFDNLLVEQAQRLGVEFRGGFRAGELLREGGRVVGVRGRDAGGGEPVELRADYVLCCDGAHSIFSTDTRPKRTISTLMGWWDNFAFEPHTMEMIFDKNLAPLYGWMFPETNERVNIGICIDGEEADGSKQTRNVREVFQRFLDDNFRDRLHSARPIGRWKGHPISYTTWIRDASGPGVLFTGECARITHNATGEGIFQAMESGAYAAEALADVVSGRVPEARAWNRYAWRLRRRFTLGFLVGHAVRGLVRTPLLDGIALAYNSRAVRKLATSVIGAALAGSHIDVARAAAPPTDGAAVEAARPDEVSADTRQALMN